MPKTKKELKEIEEETKEVLKKKTTSSKSKTTKKTEDTVKATKKASAESKTKKSATKKTATTTKKADEKTKKAKATTKKTEKKEKETKPKAKKTTKSKTKKVEESKKTKTVSKTSAKKTEKKVKQEYLQEYYDLPYRYNETVVKILAQTPKRLFVYWEISEKDRETYLNAFGEDFFEKTYPVLLVHNEEMNYTFEVPINDFANSWYLDIQDPKTKYVVQLGRKFRNVQDIRPSKEIAQKENIQIQNDYIPITDSNRLEVPNDHILFESINDQVLYRNVKNGAEYKKDISDIIEKIGKSYKEISIEKIYKELYGDEISEDILSNPSSGALSSSGFKIK